MEKMENVTYMQAGPVLIIGLPEEVDDHVCNGIREETDRYISAGKVQKLIFDFSKTGFMDSSGIGILLGRYKRMHHMGGEVLVNTVIRVRFAAAAADGGDMEEQQKELDGKWLQEGVQRMMVMLESDSRNESFARVCVASFMTRMNPTVAETDDVKTAVSEAVTNSIVHGYPYEKGLIRLVCAIEKDTLTVQIRDWGRGIENVKKAMEPMYSQSVRGTERSGMGFCFMEAFMDDLKVSSSVGNGTLVQMKKKICGGKRTE